MAKNALIIQEDLILRKILERLVTSVGFSCVALSSLYEFDITEVKDAIHIVITDILFEGIGPLDYPVQLEEAIPLENLMIVTYMGQESIKNEVMGIKNVLGFYDIPFDLDDIQKQLILL